MCVLSQYRSMLEKKYVLARLSPQIKLYPVVLQMKPNLSQVDSCSMLLNGKVQLKNCKFSLHLLLQADGKSGEVL